MQWDTEPDVSDGIEPSLPGEDEMTATPVDLPESWTGLDTEATEEERTALGRLAALGVPRPTLGVEAADGIPVSLAWPEQRIAAAFELTATDAAELGAAGWRVFPIGEELREALAQVHPG
jgi:hypothetical protein